MRTVLAALTLIVLTSLYGTIVIVASMLGVPQRQGSIYERLARGWARGLCWAAGARIHVHHAERIRHDGPAIYVANHVSWFDIFALASVLPHYTFIAKAELRKLWIFGRAAAAVGIVFIERTNRKAAFESYRAAAEQVEAGGKSVVVCPEGTRGYTYELRPFKKGPFVFAITANVPIVPTIVYGAREVQPKGSYRIRSGDIHIHLLEPVSTAGFSYAERDALMRVVWHRMADALEETYGVVSAGNEIAREGETPKIPTSFL